MKISRKSNFLAFEVKYFTYLDLSYDRDDFNSILSIKLCYWIGMVDLRYVFSSLKLAEVGRTALVGNVNQHESIHRFITPETSRSSICYESSRSACISY
ncbi:MAG: hypothetical protein ACR5K9_00575 [Wolbachia sp.]